MAIDFELPEFVQQQQMMTQWLAEATMRPHARDLDENEHQRPAAFIEQIWPILKEMQQSALKKLTKPKDADPQKLIDNTATENIFPGVPLARWYPQLADCMLIAVTEKRTKQDIDRLAELVANM